MELFYLLLITLILHFSAVIYSFFALIQRWGFYWIFPFFASALFFLSKLLDTLAGSKEVVTVSGPELLKVLLEPAGAFFWLVGLIFIHNKFVKSKNEIFSHTMMLDSYAAKGVPLSHNRSSSASAFEVIDDE